MTSAQRHIPQSLVATPLALALLVSGCGTPFKPLPGPVEYGRSKPPESMLPGTSGGKAQTSTLIENMSAQPSVRATPNSGPAATETVVPGGDEEVSIAIEQTPLPMFIQILYGSILKRAYSLDPAVTSRTDPVTFKTSRPMSKTRMQQIAGNLLRSYGLAVIELDGLVRITADANNQNTSLKVQKGTELAAGVGSFQAGYQYVELSVIRVAEMTPWLRQILNTRVALQEDTGRNALLLSGTQSDLKAAIDLIQAFDQPRMRGRVARRIAPAYASASELSNRLNEALTTQGFSVSTSGTTGSAAIILMPVPAISSVFAFASSAEVMETVERWARELDRPSSGPSANALFTYAVKFADAQELAKTLGELLGGGAQTPSSGSSASVSRIPGRVVVNNATNTLIFKGSSADEQQQIKDLLRELDRPTKSAMIEVVVAEVSRGGLEELGIKWDYNRSGVAGANQRTAKVGGDGFNLSFGNNAATILGALNALATDKQARILSNPKVLARNGETASIQVGNEVPIITSQQTANTGGSFFPGSTNLVQQVQYRSTGVILRVRPVINAGKRLDLDISQEVSSASSTKTGVSSSPTISTRRIETKLSLRDGSTILLGGLIARDDSVSDSGVPFLKDIPGLGSLFKSQSNANNQTELLVMITPYVVNDDYEAEELTQAIQNTFGDWAKDVKTSRVARDPMAQSNPLASAPPASTPDKSASELLSAPPQEKPAVGPESTAESAEPRTDTSKSDFEISRPAGMPAQQEAAKPQVPAGPAASASAATPTASKPPVALPAGAKGSAVTDPKVLEDILKLVKPK